MYGEGGVGEGLDNNSFLERAVLQKRHGTIGLEDENLFDFFKLLGRDQMTMILSDIAPWGQVLD